MFGTNVAVKYASFVTKCLAWDVKFGRTLQAISFSLIHPLQFIQCFRKISGKNACVEIKDKNFLSVLI